VSLPAPSVAKGVKPVSKVKILLVAINRRFRGRFLLTKQAFFYSIEYLETNTYNGLLFKLFREKPWFTPVKRLFVNSVIGLYIGG
jgi:hypothetical protein